jgi:lipopolysaccharide transport system permease protein
MVPASPERASTAAGVGRLFRPRPYLDAFREVASVLARNRVLTLEIVKRDLRGQHAGQVLGRAWGIAQPLLLLALYAFVFGVVFRVRIGDTFELPRNYTIYLLSGMVPWLAFVQSMARGATALTDNAQLVKNTLFQLEILPVSRALAALLPLGVGLAFLAVFTLVTEQGLPATYLLVPVLVVCQLLAMTGFAFALSALGTVARDVREVIQVISVLGIFVLPIVYLPDAIPEAFQPLLYLNPFSYMVWAYQDALYFGRIEHPYAWAVLVLGALFAFVTGYRLFRKVKPYFGNVL